MNTLKMIVALRPVVLSLAATIVAMLPAAAAYAVDYGHGIAFGVGMQAIEVSVGVSLGLFFLAREGLSVGVLKRMPDAGEPGLFARPLPLEVKDV